MDQLEEKENQQHNMKKFPKRLVEAHRGAKGLVKFENTIEAFEKAIEVNSDAVELDVRRTKDNVIIVRHDGDYKGVNICDYNYDELKALSLREEGFYMPTLEEVACRFHHRILLDVELKEAGYEKDVLDILFKYLKPNEFYIRSFNIKALRAVKKINKEVPTALLLGSVSFKKPFRLLSIVFPLGRIMYTKCNFVSPHYRLLKLGFKMRMRILRKPILVWTVNDKPLMKKLLIDKKIDGVVTNYPNLAMEVLKENNIR